MGLYLSWTPRKEQNHWTKSGDRKRLHWFPLSILDDQDRHGHCGSTSKESFWNRYVLAICDYATRFPEAVPMKSVDAKNVAEELLELFTQVGNPNGPGVQLYFTASFRVVPHAAYT